MSGRSIAGIGAAILIVIAGCGATLYYRANNPERGPLDDAARKAAGGSYVKLGDGVTHYELSGADTGRLVVLVHGNSVPYYIWDSTTVALRAAGFRVLRYDMYGRGTSDRPNTTYNADLLDRQLVQLLDAVRAPKTFDLAGLSMGGLVVATFADRHPDRLRTLTMLDPAAGGRGTLPRSFSIPGLREFLWQTRDVPKMADGQPSDFAEPTRWPGWADRYRPQTHYDGFGRAMLSTRIENAKIDKDSVLALVAKHNIPTLLIWGTEDKTVPYVHAKTVRHLLPAAEFHSIPGAGHLPGMEKSAQTNGLIVRFLRAH